MPVTITAVIDPCNPARNQVRQVDWLAGMTLDYYVDGRLPAVAGVRYVVALNGRIIREPHTDIVILDGDMIAVGARLEITSAAAAVGTWLAGALFPAGLGIMGSVLGYAAAYVVGYVGTMFVAGWGLSKIVGLLAPDPPQMPGTASSYDQAEQTYGWGDLGQTTTEGTAIMEVYGANRVSGQVLDQYVDVQDNKEILYVLLAIGRQVDSITDIRINNQPYTYFRGVSVETRLGTLTDTPIPGFAEVHGQSEVNAKMMSGVPLTRTTDGDLVEKLRFIVTAPAGIYYANNQAGLDSRSVTFTIEYKQHGAVSWTLFNTITLTGATTEAIRKVYTIDNLEPDQYDMRLTRTTADSTDYRNRTDIYWMYWDEIIKEAYIYPGIAKYAIKALASEDISGSKPAFTCLATVSTVQVFDTSLATPAWVAKSATNLAWICYHRLIRGQVDKDLLIYDEFKTFADYNDEDVSAPGDPAEKRNVASMVFSTGNLWSNVQKAARIGQAAVIYRGSDIGVFVDKAETTVAHVFNMGNILDETFEMNYLEEENRANCVEIEYTDPDRDFTRQPVSVHSREFLESTSVAKTVQVPIEAAIPQKQAVRAGVRLINSNKYFLRAPSFGAFVDSFGCVVGDLCYFQHEVVNYDGQNLGGRIIGAGNDYNVDVLDLPNDPENEIPWVRLDRSVTIETGVSHKVFIRLGDDSHVEKTVDTPAGVTDTLFLASPWISMPEPKDLYNFGRVTSGYLKPYRIVDIGARDDFTASLVLGEYIHDIYTDNSDYVIEAPPWENQVQEAVNVMANEFLTYAADGSYTSNINVSWHSAYSSNQASWNVWLEDITQGGAPGHLAYVHGLQYTITAPLIVGHEYRVIIAAGDKGPVTGAGNYTAVTVQGKLAPPANVINFTGVWDSIHRAVHFTWSAVSDIDLLHYEIREGGSWDANPDPVKKSIETGTSIYIAEGVAETKTYRIKAKDTSGIYSAAEATVAVPIDTSDCPLSIPGDLDLSSASVIANDGRNIVTLLATWNADSESSDNWHHYEIMLEDTDTERASFFSTTLREFQWELLPNKEYGVTVRAVDVSGNRTAWATMVLHTTAKDTTAPAAPAWPVSGFAIAGFKVIGLRWNQNTEYDLSHYILERSTVSDFSAAVTVLGEIRATFHADSNGLEVDTEYFYRLTAVDTSGNTSGYSDIKSATTLQIGTTDIAADAIIADHINVTNLAAISAILGTITSGKLQNSAGTTFFDLDNNRLKLGDQFDFNNGVLTLTGIGGGVSYPEVRQDPGFAVSANCVLTGRSVTRTGGTAGWNEQCYTTLSFTGHAFVSFKAGQIDKYLMAGLNTDPTTNAGYNSIDYCFYPMITGLVSIYESGVIVGTVGSFGPYTPETVFSIEYTGAQIIYKMDGVVKRSVSVSAGLTFYFDSSIYDAATTIADMVFLEYPTPVPPYSVGELWQDGVTIKRCINAKAAGQAYDAADWTISSTNNASWAASGDITKIDGGRISTGTVTADAIGANQIISSAANITDAVITGAKIANAAIAEANIGAAAVTNAKIGSLAVTTLKIADRAVTIPVSAYTAGYVNLPSGSYLDVQSATIVSEGSPISIVFSCKGVTTGPGNSTVHFRIVRDSTVLVDYPNISVYSEPINFSINDTPGAGSHTYYVQGTLAVLPISSYGARNLLLLETKK